MRLYLVRHAKSQRNAHIASSIDAPLTEDGKEQARRLGVRFRGMKIDRIYCSTLMRAKETLKEILAYLPGIPVVYTNKIIEHDMGVFGEQGIDDWGSYVAEAHKKGIPFHLFRPPKGESLLDTYKRAGSFYQELVKKHPHENVLVVGHGIVSLHLILNSLNLDVTEGRYYSLSNASVSKIVINKDKVSSFHINDYQHLILGGMKRQRQAFKGTPP
ncbi:histidine phosphatase family protein [Candidatus Pacearchaeota archaeon]|nr:histidine phosphatase family protein [Candidatus Pacearchaeota archaeon]